MVSLKQKRQSGFTIVELLIVIVIIGILAGLVVTQILGATAKARDTERKTDIDQIANQLEAYYAKTGGYPSATDLGTLAWRTPNEVSMGDSAKSMYDPSITVPASVPATYTFGNNTAPTAIGAYNYVPTPASCNSPTDSATPPAAGATPYCTGYTLATYLENDKKAYTKTNASQ
jgi:type II secretion system protein G